MNGENRLRVTDESVEVQDFMKVLDHFRGIYRIYFNLMKESRKMLACDQLDLQTLEIQPFRVDVPIFPTT